MDMTSADSGKTVHFVLQPPTEAIFSAKTSFLFALSVITLTRDSDADEVLQYLSTRTLPELVMGFALLAKFVGDLTTADEWSEKISQYIATLDGIA